jgi:hypothetical protein
VGSSLPSTFLSDVYYGVDNADLLCFMEKTKMCILSVQNINEPVFDEPVVSSGYLARFKDLEVRVVTLGTIWVCCCWCCVMLLFLHFRRAAAASRAAKPRVRD